MVPKQKVIYYLLRHKSLTFDISTVIESHSHLLRVLTNSTIGICTIKEDRKSYCKNLYRPEIVNQGKQIGKIMKILDSSSRFTQIKTRHSQVLEEKIL